MPLLQSSSCLEEDIYNAIREEKMDEEEDEAEEERGRGRVREREEEKKKCDELERE